MAFDFPSNPVPDEVYATGGVTYTWNGYAWISSGITGGEGNTAADIPVEPPVAGGSNVQDALQGLYNTKVEKAGDIMTGPLILHADPSSQFMAATKQYVDNMAASLSAVYVGDVPPPNAPDNSLWWESDSGVLYIHYNDGFGPSQWVVAVATPVVDTAALLDQIAKLAERVAALEAS